jgi:uncharacterized protein YktA (UPF0223 family)
MFVKIIYYKFNMSENTNSDLNELLNCPYCGEQFSKINKPLVMKCTHNICSECHSLNLTRILCLSCNSVYEGKENKKHPINFLLLDIIEKSQGLVKSKNNSKEKNELTFTCKTCNLTLPNKDFHNKNFPEHVLIANEPVSKEDKHSRLVAKSESLMKEYKEFNDKLTIGNDVFVENIFQSFYSTRDEVISQIKKNSYLDNLVLAGIVNLSDKERIVEFSEFYKNERVREIIKSSSTFDEIIKAFPENLKIENFLSAYYNFNQIRANKLTEKNIKEKLNLLDSYLNDKDVIKQLTNAFSHDLIIQIFDLTGLDRADEENIHRCPYVLKENKIVFFDVSTESLNEFNLSEYITSLDGKNILTSTIDEDNNLFIITSDKEIYMINIKSKSFNKININSNSTVSYIPGFVKRDSLTGLSMYATKSRLYFIYNNGKSSSMDEYNYSKNRWRALHNCPVTFTTSNPKIVRFDSDYIYVFDTLRNFAYYHIIDDEWVLCKPCYRDSYNLNLENFILAPIPSSAVLILGGYYKDSDGNKIANGDIFYLKDSECIMSIRGKFNQIDSNSLLSYGYYNSNHFILEYNEGVKKIHKTSNLILLKWESSNK